MLQLNLVKERLIFLSPAVQSGKERELTINDFKIISGLGTGAFGEVYKVEKISNKVIYALKKISKQKLKSHSLANQMKMEVKIMYRLAHPNVLKIINHFEDDDAVYLVLEFAEGGQLYNSLKEKGTFDEKTALQYMREMVSAIDYCHSRDPPIIHRDIKPENILLGSGGHIKLADFGWSTFLTPTKPRTTYCGTLDYLAPEIIDEAGHDLSLDYWCLGVLAYEFLTGKVPFAPAEGTRDPRLIQMQVTENILKGEVEFPKDFPPQAKDLIAKLLSRDPKQRGTIQEIKQHPWLKMGGSKIEPKISRVQKESASVLTGSSQTVSINTVSQEKAAVEGAVGRETNKQAERKPTEIASPKTLELQVSKSDDLFERFSMSVKNGNIEKQEIVEKLEKTVQELRREVIDVNSKLKMRDDEIKNMKEGNIDKNEVVIQAARSSTDAKRIVMLEEQNQKLTQEVDELWNALEAKEAKVQNMSRELKKVDEMKNLLEKCKTKKKALKSQLKEAQSKLCETNGKVIEIQKDKEHEKIKYERMLSYGEVNSPVKFANPEQRKIEQLMQFANSALEEMQEKISVYHGNKDNLERIEKELYDKNVELVKLQSEVQRKINETKRQLELEHQSQLEQTKEEFKKELEKVEMRHKEVTSSIEQELSALKAIHFEKEKADAVIADFKSQIATLMTNNDTLSRICANLQTLKDDNEKKIRDLKNEVEDYRIKIRDHLKKTQST